MNEYYPPDFDPEKLPRMRQMGGQGQGRDKIMEIRTMLPWNIRCNTCGHYMHRGTKFNSRVEAAIDYPKYLDYITIRRFYIRCLNCVSNITFVTDPEAVDYAMEKGATRLFETRRLNATLEKQEKERREKEAKENPMAALEKRTEDSQREMLLLENLAELTEERKQKLTITDDIMLKNIQKSAEEKEELDDKILTTLAREVMRKESRLDDTKKPSKRKPQEEKEKSEFSFGKKKKLVDARSKLGSGFGGIKVKGKAIVTKPAEPTKPEKTVIPGTPTEPEIAPNPLGLAYSDDSDSE